MVCWLLWRFEPDGSLLGYQVFENAYACEEARAKLPAPAFCEQWAWDP